MNLHISTATSRINFIQTISKCSAWWNRANQYNSIVVCPTRNTFFQMRVVYIPYKVQCTVQLIHRSTAVRTITNTTQNKRCLSRSYLCKTSNISLKNIKQENCFWKSNVLSLFAVKIAKHRFKKKFDCYDVSLNFLANFFCHLLQSTVSQPASHSKVDIDEQTILDDFVHSTRSTPSVL